MAFIEKTGKSVEEAVAEALKELNITAEEAVVEVIETGRKGIFGIGRRDAKVRVSVKEAVSEETAAPEFKSVKEATAVAVDAVKEAAAVAASALSAKAAEVKDQAAVKAAELGQQAAEKATELGQQAAVKATEFGQQAAEKATEFGQQAAVKAAEVKEKAVDSAISALEALKSESKPEAAPAAREPRKYAVNDESVKAAKEFLMKVFKAMKIEVAMEKFVNKTDGSVTIKLHGGDMGILIGKHGQTLDSLQYLTNLVANKNSSERVRIIIDVEDYRERRIETLNRLASRLADKVKRTGERVALEPMNPHERKIIHMALQGDRRVTTLSEGDEPYRHVVIELKK